VESLINNIQFWNAGATGSADSDGEIFEVHNGYAPTLRLTAHRFVPRDANLLQHIVWRVPGSPDFNRLPSTSYGLKGEVSAETFDDYLDKHVQCVIDNELRPSSDEVPIVASTMRAAQEYAQGNKNLVTPCSESLESILEKLTVGPNRASSLRRHCAFGLPRRFSSAAHGESGVRTLSG